jgi:tight adherence protein C
MSLSLILLLVLLIVACSVAVYAFQLNRERREVLSRADGRTGTVHLPLAILRPEGGGLIARIGSWLRDRVPTSWSEPGSAGDVLLHAGFDSPAAPVLYATIRLGCLVILPLAGLVFSPHDDLRVVAGLVALGFVAGLLGPRAVIDRMAQNRRTRMRKSLPDCLDLLVVCVEAGVSLDAAMLRVARDMDLAHPELSAELLVAIRKMNAGLTREEAIGGLWRRTGLDELRGLSTSIIQSERLGTSIARVLRVYAATQRQKRKQSAEKKAAEASLKMIVPLTLFMLPALFAIVLGPALFKISTILKTIGT